MRFWGHWKQVEEDGPKVLFVKDNVDKNLVEKSSDTVTEVVLVLEKLEESLEEDEEKGGPDEEVGQNSLSFVEHWGSGKSRMCKNPSGKLGCLLDGGRFG